MIVVMTVNIFRTSTTSGNCYSVYMQILDPRQVWERRKKNFINITLIDELNF